MICRVINKPEAKRMREVKQEIDGVRLDRVSRLRIQHLYKSLSYTNDDIVRLLMYVDDDAIYETMQEFNRKTVELLNFMLDKFFKELD